MHFVNGYQHFEELVACSCHSCTSPRLKAWLDHLDDSKTLPSIWSHILLSVRTMAQPCSGHKKETGGLPQNVTFSILLAVEIWLLITKKLWILWVDSSGLYTLCIRMVFISHSHKWLCLRHLPLECKEAKFPWFHVHHAEKDFFQSCTRHCIVVHVG